MGRKMIDPPAPLGYPYRLYKTEDTFVLAMSKKEASQRMGTNNVKGVQVLDLISANGHAGANAILKDLGDNWMCKEGRIYYAF